MEMDARSTTSHRDLQVRLIHATGFEELPPRLDSDTLGRAADHSPLWIHFVHRPQPKVLDKVRDAYQLLPLALSEFGKRHHTSEVSFFDTSVYLAVHYPSDSDDAVETCQIEMLVGDRFVMTHQDGSVMNVAAIHDRWAGAPEPWRATSASMLYAALGLAGDRIRPVVDRLEDALHELQAQTIDPAHRGTPKRDTLYHLFDLTEQITDLHTLVSPLKQVMSRLMQSEAWFNDEQAHPYIEEVSAMIVRLDLRSGMLRTAAQRLFEVVNSLITLQRTDVSKQLTIVATVFLSLSFLASYFGQNFRYMKDAITGMGGYLV